MIWAAATLCFFGFFQSGEVMVPTVNGFGKGVDVTDKTRQTVPYAQVVATMQYMAVHDPEQGPFFKFQNDHPSSRS